MATNWPPTAPYPTWPPAELEGYDWLSFSSLNVMVKSLARKGFRRETPTAAETSSYFQGVRCDEGHLVTGTMIISPGGVRYPFAVCNNSTHRTGLVLWVIGYTPQGQPTYDLGRQSGAITA